MLASRPNRNLRSLTSIVDGSLDVLAVLAQRCHGFSNNWQDFGLNFV